MLQLLKSSATRLIGAILSLLSRMAAPVWIRGIHFSAEASDEGLEFRFALRLATTDHHDHRPLTLDWMRPRLRLSECSLNGARLDRSRGEDCTLNGRIAVLVIEPGWSWNDVRIEASGVLATEDTAQGAGLVALSASKSGPQPVSQVAGRLLLPRIHVVGGQGVGIVLSGLATAAPREHVMSGELLEVCAILGDEKESCRVGTMELVAVRQGSEIDATARRSVLDELARKVQFITDLLEAPIHARVAVVFTAVEPREEPPGTIIAGNATWYGVGSAAYDMQIIPQLARTWLGTGTAIHGDGRFAIEGCLRSAIALEWLRVSGQHAYLHAAVRHYQEKADSLSAASLSRRLDAIPSQTLSAALAVRIFGALQRDRAALDVIRRIFHENWGTSVSTSLVLSELATVAVTLRDKNRKGRLEVSCVGPMKSDSQT